MNSAERIAQLEKKLKEVADIAEAIITTLLPDDEEDCLALICECYQLRSDLETFEHLTGKMVIPDAAFEDDDEEE